MERTPTTNVESEANFEGNDSLLLIERLNNPRIRTQVIDLLLEAEESERGVIIEVTEFDEHGVQKGPSVKKSYEPKSREQLEAEYDEALRDISTSTPIRMAEHPFDGPTEQAMVIGAKSPWSNRPYTEKELSIIEAHEKGHRIRPYNYDSLQTYFAQGFDSNSIRFTPKELMIYRKTLPETDQEKTDEEIIALYSEYLSSPVEIAERMGQLKNYFGLRGDGVFTKEHLDYARIHYMKDTGMDNGMRPFFQAITKEREEAFLTIINEAGI